MSLSQTGSQPLHKDISGEASQSQEVARDSLTRHKQQTIYKHQTQRSPILECWFMASDWLVFAVSKERENSLHCPFLNLLGSSPRENFSSVRESPCTKGLFSNVSVEKKGNRFQWCVNLRWEMITNEVLKPSHPLGPGLQFVIIDFALVIGK